MWLYEHLTLFFIWRLSGVSGKNNEVTFCCFVNLPVSLHKLQEFFSWNWIKTFILCNHEHTSEDPILGFTSAERYFQTYVCQNDNKGWFTMIVFKMTETDHLKLCVRNSTSNQAESEITDC